MMEEGKFVSPASKMPSRVEDTEKTYIQIIEEVINTSLPDIEYFALCS